MYVITFNTCLLYDLNPIDLIYVWLHRTYRTWHLAHIVQKLDTSRTHPCDHIFSILSSQRYFQVDRTPRQIAREFWNGRQALWFCDVRAISCLCHTKKRNRHEMIRQHSIIQIHNVSPLLRSNPSFNHGWTNLYSVDFAIYFGLLSRILGRNEETYCQYRII